MARPRKEPQVPGDKIEDAPAVDAPVVKDSDLPRACDIDPKTLTKAVLTQDGWVCPG